MGAVQWACQKIEMSTPQLLLTVLQPQYHTAPTMQPPPSDIQLLLETTPHLKELTQNKSHSPCQIGFTQWISHTLLVTYVSTTSKQDTIIRLAPTTAFLHRSDANPRRGEGRINRRRHHDRQNLPPQGECQPVHRLRRGPSRISRHIQTCEEYRLSTPWPTHFSQKI